VLVIAETSATDAGGPSKTKSDSTDGGAPAAPEASSDLATDGGVSAVPDAGALSCSGIVPELCDFPQGQLNGPRNSACGDSCECARGLYCRPLDQYSGIGMCCKDGPCGAACVSACDCGSGQCVAGRCR
jgi:hypothetical protein